MNRRRRGPPACGITEVDRASFRSAGREVKGGEEATMADVVTQTHSPSQRHSEGLGGLTPIEKRTDTVPIQIARKLLEYLLKGSLRPGDRLPSERKLAEALGVGRSVVREALKSLTLLGLVAVRQGDGSFLKSTESDLLPQAIEWGLLLGAKRTRDLVEARCYLEVTVAGLAAERRDDAAMADLKRHLERMQQATGADAFVAGDVAFHLRLAEAANNETLLQIMVSIRSLLQVWITRVMYNETDFAISYNEHARIYDAILARDVPGARKAMDEHVMAASHRLDGALAAETPGAEPGAQNVGS